MPLPNFDHVKIPLLLEMERSGGRIRRSESEFFDRVTGHFPRITRDDLRLLQQDGKTNLWQNRVEWVRYVLRKEERIGGPRGVWEITPQGKQWLREELQTLGVPRTEVESFIRSRTTLRQAVGEKWNPPDANIRTSPPPRDKQSSRISTSPSNTPVEVTGSRWNPPDLNMQTGATPPPTPTPVPPAPSPSASAAAQSSASPALSLGELLEAERRRVRDELRQRLFRLDSRQFEHLCRHLLQSQGLANVEVTGRSGDGGVDGHGTIRLLDMRVAFQAKRWQNHVAGDPIRAFRGSLRQYERGIFITTSSFTPGAKEEAKKDGAIPITLVDGEQIVDTMIEKGLGLVAEPATILRIDDDFFGQF